ncbi:MAG: formylglycine-generating enzyme family protein, partial [Planctomycetes bacterium]|nr:formylglycine-generating enzyme family protein [Planctomycetota bacterium]
LPTEAEWEYACRAGTATRFYWGDDPTYSEIGSYAWYRGNAYDAGEEYAHVVGQKLPSAWGLYDMSGNVWEWCQDSYGAYPVGPVVDPAGSPTGAYRVIRGGSLNNGPRYCRSAYRGGIYPWRRGNDLGFRLARQ